MQAAAQAEALHRQGVACAGQGRLEDAFAHFERALQLDPGHLEARLHAAAILSAHDYRQDAVQLLLGGMKTRAQDPRLRTALAGALEGFPLETAGDAVRKVLLDLCLDETLAAQALADAILGLVKNARGFPAAASLVHDPLLQALLRRAVVNDEAVERALTGLRRDILLRRAGDVPLPFLCALAQQCFNNEYAWWISAEESGALEELRPADECSLAIAAMYRPLHRLPGLELSAPPSPAFEPLWRAQVLEPREEAELARRIEALTPVDDAASHAVRAMYEENPYPRWLTMLHPRPQTLAEGAPRSILVAGGGTGQHPIQVALRYPESEVLAVDLSRASLAYATRMAARFGTANLSFRQADLLRLGQLARKFDLVESLGVLHHLRDPMEGWRVLAGLLADGGAMRIGLYSERARQPLEAARAHLASLGLDASAAGIRAARRALLDLPTGHPARQAAESDDFFSSSGCRDLLLHVQEHDFTPLRIADCLAELGLRFTGFDCPPPVRTKFLALAGGPAALNDLAAWDRFEAAHPQTFRGMYFFSCVRES
jgi:SAM-dependent methyltransferase